MQPSTLYLRLEEVRDRELRHPFSAACERLPRDVEEEHVQVPSGMSEEQRENAPVRGLWMVLVGHAGGVHQSWIQKIRQAPTN